ncbi:hypothetical protein XAR_1036 [Xanthomonas citri pv. glycines str. 8ra]|nr:hypothetical protein XAR_1036 [Xanthomonas citri pv. glycines str. 8ra]
MKEARKLADARQRHQRPVAGHCGPVPSTPARCLQLVLHQSVATRRRHRNTRMLTLKSSIGSMRCPFIFRQFVLLQSAALESPEAAEQAGQP